MLNYLRVSMGNEMPFTQSWSKAGMECWKRAMGDTWGSSPGGQGSLPRMFNAACVTNAAKQQLLRTDNYLQDSPRRTGSKHTLWRVNPAEAQRQEPVRAAAMSFALLWVK